MTSKAFEPPRKWPELGLKRCKIIRITAPHFVIGLVLEEGRVVRAAPIAHYMHGWDAQKVFDYCVKKGWSYELQDDMP